MNTKIQDALNAQIQEEFSAFYTYLSMSAWLEDNDWPGSAAWIADDHSAEEQMHAMKIYQFINDRNGTVTLQAIDQPPTEFASVVQVFELALAHEQKVTASINHIYKLAQEEGDYPTQVLMQWFIDEQVEEEKVVNDALVMVRRAGDDPFQLMYVDSLISQQGGSEGEAAA